MKALEDQPLSAALLKLELYATSLGLLELMEWASKELNSYSEGDVVPIYRRINFHWLGEDLRPKRLNIADPEKDLFWHHTYLTFGVDTIEAWKGDINFDNPNMRNSLESQNPGLRLGGQRIIEEVYLSLLTRIHNEAQRRLAATIPRGAILTIKYPLPDFGLITPQPELQSILSSRWHEANSAFNAGAPLATIILLGSILEGCLLAGAQRHPQQANSAASAPKRLDASVKPFGQWTLSEFIAVAHDLGWIRRTTRDFSGAVRDYRNFVHPREQARSGLFLSDGDARVTWEVVSSAISELILSL